jgi:hypothetical protein
MACILPDVLRSGSRYERWREGIAASADVISIEPMGRFDGDTDVDVFILVLARRDQPPGRAWPSEPGAPHRIEHDWDVHVGSVVPHRHPERGPLVRYLHAAALPPLAVAEQRETRRFDGRVFDPPFVVVRRTSRPRTSPGPRLIANVIHGRGPVAVENHLLVLKPRVGGVLACRRLIEHLTGAAISASLNHSAARRHLTVGDLRRLPAPPGNLRG